MARAAAEQWSPSGMIEEALASDLDPGIFSTIDEGDVPKSGNFLDFCINKKFLNVLPWNLVHLLVSGRDALDVILA